jgi:hypothetical protein
VDTDYEEKKKQTG